MKRSHILAIIKQSKKPYLLIKETKPYPSHNDTKPDQNNEFEIEAVSSHNGNRSHSLAIHNIAVK